MKKYTIAIIGGTSPFGTLWKNYFEEKNQEVLIATNNTKLTPIEAVQKANIIIISVPIRYTKETIKKLVPYVGKNKLLIDFTGIKMEAVSELKKYTKGEVVSVHPMFGPWIKGLKDQNISFDPIMPGEKWEFIKNLWDNDGANLIKIESSKHDEFVSIVQSSVHIMNLLLGHVLKKRGINLEKMMKISTPNSRMQLFILSRFLNQNASLYTDMQMHNDLYKNEILPDIKEYFEFADDLIQNDKKQEFENEFNDIKKYIGEDFITKAFNITQKIDSELKKDL